MWKIIRVNVETIVTFKSACGEDWTESMTVNYSYNENSTAT